MEKEKKVKLYFLISTILIIFSGLMAHGFQSHFGSVDVQQVAIVDEFNGFRVEGKMYIPKTATLATPAPGILALHGYNNDKDLQRPASLELAKAGFVVLAIDQIGHGDSEGAVNFYLQGSNAAYNWLQGLPMVNGDKMGIFGHSMGYIVASQVAVMNPDHDAVGFETFPPILYNFTLLNNVLHIWSEYEEFFTVGSASITGSLPTPEYTVDMTVDEIIEQGLDIAGQNAGLTGPAEVDTTYGNFSAGTAYREHFRAGLTHPGQTMDPKVTAEIVAWMLQALTGASESEAWDTANVSTQTFMAADIFSGAALFFSFVSVMFLAQILMKYKFFEEVKQPMPKKVPTTNKLEWWAFATINTFLAGLFFMLFTHADQDWGFAVLAPFLRMGMINNWLGFFLTTAAAAVLLVGLWVYIVNRLERESVTAYDLGFIYTEEKFTVSVKNTANWQIFGKTLLLAGILFGWMYLIVSIFQDAFMIEFRIFWPFAKKFTMERFGQFLLYLPIILPFFVVNGGAFLFGQIRQEEYESGIKTQIVWWLKILYATLAGLIVVLLIQYIGVAITNYPYAGWPNSPIMPIQLFSMIPLSALLYFIMTYFYRKTGKIYLGSFFAAIIVVWFFTVGTVVGFGL